MLFASFPKGVFLQWEHIYEKPKKAKAMGKVRLDISPGEDLHSCSWEQGILPPERSNRIYHRCLIDISVLENYFEHAYMIDRQS